MILCRLRLENFKKYTSYEIEFGEGLIGIIGKNGSGKSTIFEAILFALYGELKNKGYKEIIRNSNASIKDAVSVELDFEFEGLEYGVVREFRGKALSANAKFFKNGEVITTGAKEVTNSIIKLTKMSKDAFLHTLFASQKELTSLSTLKNEDRKKMIRKLLGLEKIDFVENSLIEKSRQLKREITASAEFLLGNDEVKSKKEKIREDTKAKKELEKEVKIKAKELENTKAKEKSLKNELAIFAKTKEQKQKLTSELELIKNGINANIQNQTKLSNELKNLEDKNKELKALESVKKDYETLHVSLKEQENLKNIQIKKEGLEKELVQLRIQYTKSKNDIKTLEDECGDYDKLLEKAKKSEEGKSALQKELSQNQTIQKKLQNEISAEQGVVEDNKKKISKIKALGRESNCPTCTRALLEEYDNVLSSLNEIVKQTQSQKIDKANIKLQATNKQIKELEICKEQIEKESHEISKAISLIQSKQKDLTKANEHFAQVSEKGKTNKQELEKLAKHFYDEKQHTAIPKQL